MSENLKYWKEQFDELKAAPGPHGLQAVRQEAFDNLNKWGLPGNKHEEWKYTRVSPLLNRVYRFHGEQVTLTAEELDEVRLPGHENANELVFVNGFYLPERSTIRSNNVEILPLEEALEKGYETIIKENFNHSAPYLKDAVHALNTAFVDDAVFVALKKEEEAEHPLYIYHITDSRQAPVLSQPRCLIHLAARAELKIVENFVTLGDSESFTNQVVEMILQKDARLEYYKIQNDKHDASQVSTTHIRQVETSFAHTVLLSLNGGIVRNNTQVVMDAPHCEAHLYGLYFQNGKSHIDNHTVVDNAQPHCYSNELYKGMLDDQSTGVFNGKIFVREDAQKINAFQSNKNILLSDDASVNTKPQLEIFADDVKCSHGCTVGQLDEEALFYLRARGIPEKVAKAMLLEGFAGDIIEQIKLDPIREWASGLIAKQLNLHE